MSAPLDAVVDPKMRARIWSNEYIDLYQLVKTDTARSVMVTQIGLDGAQENQTLLMPSGKKPTLRDYFEWAHAFHVYQLLMVENTLSNIQHSSNMQTTYVS